MTSILCLAHYCDLHGPTPLMVTEGTPVPCNVCYDDQLHGRPGSGPDRSRSSAPMAGEPAQATTTITDALRRMNFAGPQQQPSSSLPATEQEAQTQRAALRRSAQGASAAATSSAIETPPQSPRLPPGPKVQQQKSRQDSGFRKTYDDYVTRRAGPCDNCALTLPKLQSGSKNVGVESRPERGPTLRSKARCARVFGGLSTTSPPTSQSSSSVASEDESNSHQSRPSHRRTATAVSVTSRSSESSSVANMNVHDHWLEYISTHEPLAAASFSIVRASCLRTLSLETLPRPPPTSHMSSMSAMSTPCASPITPAFVTTHSAGNAASGGPIFFGDPATGYTTAYIFRIPDMHARGHKRVYAFLALSTHRERLAMKTFGFITKAFQDMATWIQQLAEAEAERLQVESTGSTASSPIMPGPGYGSFPEPAAPPVSLAGAAASSASSFLMGGMGGGLSRRMGAGFGSSAVTLKQRGLAELVGLPDFFIELHARFVKLLLELGIVMGA